MLILVKLASHGETQLNSAQIRQMICRKPSSATYNYLPAAQPITGANRRYDLAQTCLTQMDAALTALGIPVTPYTDPQTLTFIKAVHFTDLQARVR
jgi:hypothetical protein